MHKLAVLLALWRQVFIHPTQVLVGTLLLFAAGVAAVASLTQQPYSVKAPKRILAHHVFQQQPGGGIASDQLVIGGSDVVRVEDALDLRGLQRLPTSHRSWQVRSSDHAARCMLVSHGQVQWVLQPQACRM